MGGEGGGGGGSGGGRWRASSSAAHAPTSTKVSDGLSQSAPAVRRPAPRAITNGTEP